MEEIKRHRLLFLTNAELGQANVHLAVLEWLQLHARDLELHLCSFPSLEPAVTALNGAEHAADNCVAFHKLSGPTWKECLFNRPEHQWQEICALPPTARSVSRAASLMPRVAMPWSAEELVDLVLQVKNIVQSVDPHLVIVDNLFTPGITVCYNTDLKWCVLSPNTYREFILGHQPRYESLWKHPPTASLIPYPVPWYHIPVALYHQRQWRKNPLSPWIHENAVHLWEKTKIYYSDWGRLSFDPPSNFKIFLPSSSIVDFPFSKVPDHVVSCGPIVRHSVVVEDSDPELATWLNRRPTVYINLGTHVSYENDTKSNLAIAIKHLLQEAAKQNQELQVLWKVNRSKLDRSSDHSDLHNIFGEESKDERVKIVDWVAVEPISVLNSGAVVCSINHGGANTYFEAVSAGVPQIVLPVWFDTYDFARRVDYFGIGEIGNYNAAPKCSSNELAPILKRLILGEKANAVRERAAAMAKSCRVGGGGSEMAARGIIGMLKKEESAAN